MYIHSTETEEIEYDTIYDAYLDFGMELEWTMRDFTEIKLCDMTDEHIRGCINMLSKNKFKTNKQSWINVFQDVLMKRRTLKINKLKNNIKK